MSFRPLARNREPSESGRRARPVLVDLPLELVSAELCLVLRSRGVVSSSIIPLVVAPCVGGCDLRSCAARHAFDQARHSLSFPARFSSSVCSATGEFARLRPKSDELTGYYLTISAGGALGGLFVGLLAPRMFNEYLDLLLGLLGSRLLALWLLYGFPTKRVLRERCQPSSRRLSRCCFPILRHGITFVFEISTGILQVSELGAADAVYRSLFNRTIQHGAQFMMPDRSRIPTTDYGRASGVAIAIDKLRDGPMRVGRDRTRDRHSRYFRPRRGRISFL